MSDHFSGTGGCLCGAVSINAKEVEHKIGACHCTMCRNWAGGPFIGLDCGTEVEFQGDVSVYKSSDWAERAFCSQCGTHLYYKFRGDGKHIVPVGLFKNHPALVFDHQIFIDEKPEYYSFADDTQTLTGAQVMEMFAPQE